MIDIDEFFESPRSWFILKYKVLDKYLRSYFPKVNQKYMCPAVAADLFAGRGRFEDGTEGSPIIIARHAKRYGDRFGLRNQVVLAEASVQDREMLNENMKEFTENGTATIVPGDAVNVGRALLVGIRPGIPLFVFLDPFGLKGLSMQLLVEIFNRAKKDSTEVLINFNHRAISRRLGICKKTLGRDVRVRKQAETTIVQTSDLLGGDWWLDVLNNDALDDDEKVEVIQSKYVDVYRDHFQFLESFPVTEGLPGENVKYYLIFASRSLVAFELMNDVMCSSQQAYVSEVIRTRNQGTLFENADPMQFATRESSTDIRLLCRLVLEEAQRYAESQKVYYKSAFEVPIRRTHLRRGSIENFFARYISSEHNEAIKTLIKDHRLVAGNGRTSISDDVVFRLCE